MRFRVLVQIALGVLVGLAALITVIGVRYYLSHRDLSFDQTAWIKPAGWCEHSRRGRMVDDVVKRRLHAGMTMKRVRSLLGPPDGVADSGTTWAYDVDREDDFLMDTCVTLELWWRDNRLQRAEVMRDS
jgi:hypothetical protein